MQFQERTRLAIEEALKSLLAEMPLKKITVQMIINRCGCSRATFYYHFTDKFQVVLSIYTRMLDESYRKYPDITFREMIEGHYRCLEQNLSFARKTLDYDEQGPVIRGLTNYAIDNYEEILLRNTDIFTISEDLRFQIRFHASASIGIMTYWVADSKRDNPKMIARRLMRSMPQDLYRVIPNAE